MIDEGSCKTGEYEIHFFDSASDNLQVASLVCFHEEEEASHSLLSPLFDHQRNIVLSISIGLIFLAIFLLNKEHFFAKAI